MAAAPTATESPIRRNPAAPPVPTPRNGGDVSSSTIGANRTTVHHVFDIEGYSSMTESLGNGEGLRSLSFNVGAGSTWHVRFYPNGDRSENAGFISVRAVFDHARFVVKARIGFDMLDLTGEPVPRYARTSDVCEFATRGLRWGCGDFIKREELEKDFLKDDCFSVRCNVTVIDFFVGAPAPPRFGVAVPPPDWTQHFRDLLLSAQGADVRFQVGEEIFAAHRCVLAARSPVFKAELYGAMKEGAAEHCVRIDDMRAEVFRNLLHFAYTDSLPRSDEQEEEDDAISMAQHLMEAADRYGMERLKLVCEDKLCKKVNVSTVATTLVLAEQHRRVVLKEACFQFLLDSPTTLDAIMTTEGFDHLAKTCPSLLKELISRLAAPFPDLNEDVEASQLPPSKKPKSMPRVDAYSSDS